MDSNRWWASFGYNVVVTEVLPTCSGTFLGLHPLAAERNGRHPLVWTRMLRGPLSLATGGNMSRTSLIPPPAPSSRPNPHYSVFMDSGFIRLVRSAARFESKAQVVEARLWVGRQLDAFGRVGRGILIDSRLAPPSTDFEHGPEFPAAKGAEGMRFQHGKKRLSPRREPGRSEILRPRPRGCFR